jgi:hypothetical protein
MCARSDESDRTATLSPHCLKARTSHSTHHIPCISTLMRSASAIVFRIFIAFRPGIRGMPVICRAILSGVRTTAAAAHGDTTSSRPFAADRDDGSCTEANSRERELVWSVAVQASACVHVCVLVRARRSGARVSATRAPVSDPGGPARGRRSHRGPCAAPSTQPPPPRRLAGAALTGG